MGLLDGIAGQVLGKVLNNTSGDGLGSIVNMVHTLIDNSGGLSGLLQKLQSAGLSEQVASWLGNGTNLPINANQLISALGENTFSNLASKFGVNESEVSSGIASMLPKVVDMLTNDGKVEESSFSLDKLVSLLK
ncbi:YidB family protein [Arcobacter vandammei]|uniref:YidB family protein n=1 Tax=Arcobacter vandammei TaxID=2782243 RepID=UPI0018DFFFBF|nr:YidB family protein [Arcobacter vandammei]